MRSREENMRGMMGESRGGGRDMMRSNSDLMGRGDMIRNEMMGNMQVRMEVPSWNTLSSQLLCSCNFRTWAVA